MNNPPPQNIEAEGAVLGAILVKGEVLEKVSSILTTEDFYRENHKKLFDAMVQMNQEKIPIDVLTIFDYMKSTGDLLEEVGGSSYLTHLTELVPTTANVEHYAKLVKKVAQKRRLWEKAHRLVQATESGASEEEITALLTSISQISPVSSIDFESYSLQPSDLENLERVDLINGVIPKGSLILLSGKYGAGKSIISLGMAKKVLSCDDSVIYIDADMPLQVIEGRLGKGNLKDKLGSNFMYLHRSKCSMKIGDKVWKQFLSYMKGKSH